MYSSYSRRRSVIAKQECTNKYRERLGRKPNAPWAMRPTSCLHLGYWARDLAIPVLSEVVVLHVSEDPQLGSGDSIRTS